MANLLEIKDAQRQIGDSFALCNVNLAVAPGEIVGFVGANGAGKTTTIRAALGLMKLDAGEVHLFGEPFGPNAPDSTQRHVRSRIGVVFDTCPYPAEFTIAQMERCLAPAFPTWDKAQFWRLAEWFSLSRKAKVKDLSRGMGMKLQLAVALSHKANLLVLDEATAGLDPIARDDVLATLREFATQEGHGVLLSSHITSDLEKVADYITFIHNGKLIMTVSKNDLVYNYAVMRCKESQFLALDPKDILAYRKRDFQIDVLVSNGKEAQRKYKGVVIDHVSVDEIMLLLVKGERV